MTIKTFRYKSLEKPGEELRYRPTRWRFFIISLIVFILLATLALVVVIIYVQDREHEHHSLVLDGVPADDIKMPQNIAAAHAISPDRAPEGESHGLTEEDLRAIEKEFKIFDRGINMPNANGAPTVTKDGLMTQNATEGTAVLLHCGIDVDSAEIVWTKDGSRLNPSVGITFSEDRSAVNISSAKLSDQGSYVCKAKNSAGEAEMKIQMFVGIPPRVSDQPQHVIVKKGETAELWCEATGVPQPHITWYKDDVKITETAVDKKSETRKIFPDVGLEHAAVYTCKAENWAGTSYKEIGLVVLTAPDIIPEKENVTAELRETIYLNCNASGIPEPVISWVRPPNVEIVNNEKFELLGPTLAIRNAIEDDAGFYHCIAKSQAGQAMGTRNVILAAFTTRLGRGKPRVVSRCPEGYQENRKGQCEDINECLLEENPCDEDSTCENQQGSYDCIRTCEEGFGVRLDGTCADIDECTVGSHECGEGEQCMNTEGSYECNEACAVGFQLNDQGFCDDVDECLVATTCGRGLLCYNTLGSFTCLCPNGRPPTNGTCKRVPRVKTVPRGGRRQKKKRCPEGFYEKNGQCIDVDECSLDAPCQFKCENTKGGFQCSCPEGYTEEDGECKDIDECADSPCMEADLCFNQLGSYECLADPCPEDYELDEDNIHCVPTCEDCDLPKVQLSLLSLPNDVQSGHAIARLTAYDHDGKVLNDMDFKLAKDIRPDDYNYTRDGAFALKADKGRALVLLATPLNAGSEATLRVRAKSAAVRVPDTHFLLYIKVGEHPF